MQMSDVIADMLTRIRNANDAKHATVDIPASNMKKAIADILVAEGYVKSYQVIEDGAWLNDTLPYGTIHRIAGDGSVKGLLGKAVMTVWIIKGIFAIAKQGLVNMHTGTGNAVDRLRHKGSMQAMLHCN